MQGPQELLVLNCVEIPHIVSDLCKKYNSTQEVIDAVRRPWNKTSNPMGQNVTFFFGHC